VRVTTCQIVPSLELASVGYCCRCEGRLVMATINDSASGNGGVCKKGEARACRRSRAWNRARWRHVDACKQGVLSTAA
jgi:hypothetical protein